MKPKTFRVRCKHCGKPQLYMLTKPNLRNKSKKCVYCGRSFRVYNQII